MFTEVRHFFGKSPLFIVSLMTSGWCVVRGLLYKWQIGPTRPSPFDVPLLNLSPVATEYNLAITLSLIALIGVAAASIGLCRRKEALRWWCLPALALNLLAYWWAVSMVEWALNPPPGIDY
jgi:hypothetical protein